MKKRTETKRIIIHCLATSKAWGAGKPVDLVVREVTRWHVVDRGWSGPGYHHIIAHSGEHGTARDEALMGAHTRGHNADSIAIALTGGRGASADDAPEDHFNAAQLRALVKLVADIQRRYPGVQTIHGHNEFANKGCPGFRVEKHWDRLVEQYGERDKPAVKTKPVPWWVRLINVLFGKD